MIKLQVIGNLGKDCVVNTVNGKNVINFSVAHTEKFRDAQGNQKDKTIWVECAYWTDKTAIAPYLKKGTQVYADGQPDIRTYTTQDGRSGTSLSLRVLSVQLLGTKSNEGDNNTAQGGYNNNSTSSYSNNNYNGNGAQPVAAAPSHADMGESADDLPF